MSKPLLVVNFKNYVSGKDSLNLARNVEIYYNNAIIVPPLLDVKDIAKEVSMPVFSQHVDFQEVGKSTGFITPEGLLSSKVSGSIINHSEHKISFSVIKKTISRCHDNGLKVIVCTSTLKETIKILKLKPFAIAFEDPRLIGSGKSITNEDSKIVSSFSKLFDGSNVIPLCGAGVSSPDDVAKAIILGCKGVLVSSAIAKPAIPGNEEKFLKGLSTLF